MENAFSKEPMSADDLMKVSWKMFKERFFKFLYIFLLAVVSFLFVATILLASALSVGSGMAVLLCLLFLFVVLLVIIIIQNIMFLEVIRNKKIRIRQAFRRAVTRFRPYVGSLAFYMLIASNLIVLFIFFWLFIVMSAVCMSIISYLQSVAIIFGMTVAFMIFFVGLLLMVCAVFAYTWQYFLFFDVIIYGMPIREALDHSFSIINKNKRDVFEKSGVFLLCFALTMLTLSVISTFAPGLELIVEAGNYVMATWAIVYLYAMFEDIRATASARVDAADRQSVSLLVKSGSVIMLTVFLLMCFSLMLTLAQIQYYNSSSDAAESSGQETISAAHSL